MLTMKKGCTVPFPEKLEESYVIEDGVIRANVGADHIEDVMNHFICDHDEPLFFILEIPCTWDEEEAMCPGIFDRIEYGEEIGREVSVGTYPLHKNVYYMDNCTREEALIVLIRAGKWLIPDGMSTFGFGGQTSSEEILFSKYNELTIFTKHPESYRDFFKAHDIPETERLVTAWDTFTPEHPGQSELYKEEGKSVYDIPDMFKDWGMYLAEVREE